MDIELWDGTRTQLLGQCCLSLLPLLDPSHLRDQITAELAITGLGGLHVAGLRAHAMKLG